MVMLFPATQVCPFRMLSKILSASSSFSKEALSPSDPVLSIGTNCERTKCTDFEIVLNAENEDSLLTSLHKNIICKYIITELWTNYCHCCREVVSEIRILAAGIAALISESIQVNS
jgi:hypothetical protein